MTGPDKRTPADSAIDRIARALAHTQPQPPRPLTRLDLPLGMDRILGPHWQRTLRPAAVLVGLVDRADGPTVLLTERSHLMRDHAGQISFPGGRIEPHDVSVADAALREAHEEIALPHAASTVLGYLDDYPTVTRFCITPVVARVAPDATYAPDGVEVATAFEVPLALLMDPDNYTRRKIGRMGVEIPYYEVHWQGWRIWGATAGMLHGMAMQVREAADVD